MDEHKQESGGKVKKKRSKASWDIRPYLAVGLTAILVVVVCTAIFFLILRFQGLADGIGKIAASLQAVFIGLVLAYLLNPGMRLFERLLNKKMYEGKKEKTLKQRRFIRAISVTLAMCVFVAIIAILIRMILPQMISSVDDLVRSMNEQVQNLNDWINRLTREGSPFAVYIEDVVSNSSVELEKWLRKTFLDNSSDWITSITTGVYNVVRTIINVIIGMIISVYVLMRKETFVGQLKKLIYTVFRPKYGNVVLEVLRKADDIFGGFFVGKIIDSMIIGFICFVVLTIMRMPYTALVSVIVGVTNVIPFFGPYIGAIPSFILIFLTNPLQGVYFLIFIVILQQVDGNIIGPKILGDSTGLSPFWVIFAILLFGGCFGVVGMIFGVPIFALIYYLIKRIVEHILRIRNLPDNTLEYIRLKKVDTVDNSVEELGEEEKEKPIFRREMLNLNKKNKEK